MRRQGITILACMALTVALSFAQAPEHAVTIQSAGEEVPLGPPRAVKIKKIVRAPGREALAPEAKATQFLDPVVATLQVDDGGVGGVVGPGYPIVANRLTPPKYPATLESIVFVISGNGDAHVPRDVEIDVAIDSAGSDLGPKGASTTLLLEMTVELVDASFLNSYLLLDLPPEIRTTVYCGDLYLILRDPASEGSPYFLDTTLPQSRSWISINNGVAFSKLPLASAGVPDGGWFLRGNVDVEREPCNFAKLAGNWVLQTYKGCPAAKFSLDAAGHVGACCGLPNPQFYGYACGTNPSCTSTNTTQPVGVTVDPVTCAISIDSGGFFLPSCARHTWNVTFLDANTAVQTYTSEVRAPSGTSCSLATSCVNTHPIAGHEGFPSLHPTLEPTRGVTMGPTKPEIHWTPGPSDVASYLVLRGDLSCIKTPAVPSDPVTCLTPAGVAGSTFMDPTLTPVSGTCSAGIRGYYYLVQPVTARLKGSLNTCSEFQELPRNEHPAGDCP